MSVARRIKRFLLGQPLLDLGEPAERIPKWKALSTLSSDALSSVAYATDAILMALMAFSAFAISWSFPIALAITVLLAIVVASYRQTIDAYPWGAGAYGVARENLGSRAGLVAGAALLVDYILTVSVSVAAGVENIASALPVLHPYRDVIGVVVVVCIMFANLRGIRESSSLLAIPTHFFIISVFVLLGVGFWKWATGHPGAPGPLIESSYPSVPLVLVLRAFASGCVAFAGIETISGNISAFEPPAQKNAKITLVWMSVVLGCFFLGITALAHVYGLMPRQGETLISVLGHAVFGTSIGYYLLQLATAMVLFLAANTSYIGFPRLASVLARDGYLPRQFTSQGDRLVFSNGILGLSIASAILIAMFEGSTMKLIPLYAVGVFTSFTLSQAGMVVHHLREKKPGWVRSLTVNGIGALVTMIVLIDEVTAKFSSGAWVVVLLVPLMVMTFMKIHNHYRAVGRELALTGEVLPLQFKPVKHTVIIPVSGIHKGVIEALRYALSISDDVRACYVELDPVTTERVKDLWQKFAPNVPFVVLKSPYRSVIRPLIKYIDDVEQITHDDMITVVVPEFVTSKWWHRILHNQTALFIRAALSGQRGKVVTSVRYHLKNV